MNRREIINIKKKISFSYYLKEFYETGIVLLGWEVRALRNSSVSIQDNYVFFKQFECFVSKIYISGKNIEFENKDCTSRDRKLLLKKKEINYLFGLSRIKGYTLLISCIYLKNNFIKAELCVCFGKKKYEKMDSKNEKFSNKYLYL